MLGERIKQARLAAGMSQRDLASRAGVSAQAVSKYERNLDIPSSGVLLRLSEALGVKIDYFFRQHTVKLIAPAYRKRAALPRKEEKAILNRIQEWLERYLEAEDLFPEEYSQSFALPNEISQDVAVPEDAERIATELRSAWGLGLDPIGNLTELLEDKGIKVGLVDATEDFDACAFVTEEGSPVIVVKNCLPGDRQRFNLAHELGHIVLRSADEEFAEKAAHRFAGAFLVPEPVAYKELGKKRNELNLYELHLLKHKYGLSMQGWICRARDLGIISEKLFERLFRAFRKHGWHRKEPGDEMPPEEPKRMERIVMRALAENIISEGRAAELLGKPMAEFFKEVAERHDGFPVDLCN